MFDDLFKGDLMKQMSSFEATQGRQIRQELQFDIKTLNLTTAKAFCQQFRFQTVIFDNGKSLNFGGDILAISKTTIPFFLNSTFTANLTKEMSPFEATQGRQI